MINTEIVFDQAIIHSDFLVGLSRNEESLKLKFLNYALSNQKFVRLVNKKRCFVLPYVSYILELYDVFLCIPQTSDFLLDLLVYYNVFDNSCYYLSLTFLSNHIYNSSIRKDLQWLRKIIN